MFLLIIHSIIAWNRVGGKWGDQLKKGVEGPQGLRVPNPVQTLVGIDGFASRVDSPMQEAGILGQATPQCFGNQGPTP